MLSLLVPQVYAACTPAAGNVDLGDCYTLGIGGAKVSSVYSTPSDLVDIIVRNIFVVGGIILFFLIIFAGFKFISGGTKGKDEAVEMFKTALMGFLLMFAAYWIVRIIGIIIGQTIL